MKGDSLEAERKDQLLLCRSSLGDNYVCAEKSKAILQYFNYLLRFPNIRLNDLERLYVWDLTAQARKLTTLACPVCPSTIEPLTVTQERFHEAWKKGVNVMANDSSIL
jgi:hypothetical protein